MDFEKSLDLFGMKKEYVTWLFIEQFFYKIADNFSALILCKINIFHIFEVGDFFKTFDEKEFLAGLLYEKCP